MHNKSLPDQSFFNNFKNLIRLNKIHDIKGYIEKNKSCLNLKDKNKQSLLFYATLIKNDKE